MTMAVSLAIRTKKRCKKRKNPIKGIFDLIALLTYQYRKILEHRPEPN